LKISKILGELSEELPGKRIGAAVSGGADSVALLRLLLNVREKKEFYITVIHFDHHFREESARDALWVEKLAAEFSLPFVLIDLPKPSNKDLKDLGFEAWAHDRRLRSFSRLTEEKSFDAIALGHNAQDQIETFFIRLIRGSSLFGMAGMEKLRKLKSGDAEFTLWRPLLGIFPEELRAFLKSIGQDWLEDSTNRDTTFLRNSIRAELIPIVKNMRKKALVHILNFMQDLAESRDFIVQNKKISQSFAFNDRFPIDYNLPPFLLRENLKTWLRNFESESFRKVDRKFLSRLINLAFRNECGRKVQFGGHFIVRTADGLEAVPAAPQNSVETEKTLTKGLETKFIDKTYLLSDSPRKGFEGLWFDPRDFSSNIEVRFRRSGDVFKPVDGRGTKKLAKWLIDRKIPAHRRDKIPMVACGNQILWIPGIARSALTFEEPRENFFSSELR